FVVVVVLDDREAELPRELDEPQPPLGPQRHGRRELVVRGQEYRLDRLAPARPFHIVDVDAVLIQTNGGDLRAAGAERRHGRLVGELLDDHVVPGLQQHLAGQEDAVLAAAGDADVRRAHVQPTLAAQHGRDTLAQRRRAARVAILQAVVARGLERRGPVGPRQGVGRKQPPDGSASGRSGGGANQYCALLSAGWAALGVRAPRTGSGRDAETIVPRVPAEDSHPWAIRSSYASTTVLRLTPSAVARSRLLGRNSPDRRRPRSMSRINAWMICR